MNNYKTITNIPGWAEIFSNSEAGTVQKAYELVPLVYRCVSLKSDSLSSVPLNLYKKGNTDKPIEWPWKNFSTEDWVRKTSVALDMRGASFSVKLKNTLGGKVQGLQWLNPFSVDVSADSNANLTFKQSGAIGGSKSSWTADEMLYIRLFNPTIDYAPGISPLSVAMKDASLIYYMNRFASAYFEKGAMPVTILSIDTMTSEDEVKRFEGVMKQALTGIKNAFRVLALRGGKEMAPFKLTSDIKDLTMPQLEDRARRAICGAFGIPQTMLEDAANYATAKEHRLSFWQDTIRPHGVRIESELNRQALDQLGLEAHFAFDQLDIFQEDESERAGQLGSLVSAGFDLETACEVLGYELTDLQKARIFEKNKPAPVEVNTQPDKQKEEQPEYEPEENNASSIRSALFKWKAAALKAIKTGNNPNIEFDNPSIPEHICDAIHDALENSKSADDIHAVFKDAREWTKIQNYNNAVEVLLKQVNSLLEKQTVS